MTKLYPVAVRIFSNQHGQVISALLLICECENNIFDSELKTAGISWQQCMSISTDNASVMVVVHCGIAAFRTTQSDCIFNGLRSMVLAVSGLKRSVGDVKSGL